MGSGTDDGIEAAALVGDGHADGVGEQLRAHVYPLASLLPVTSHDGVTERLREHYLEPEPSRLERAMSREAVASDQLDRFFDALDFAGQAKSDECRGLPGVRGRGAADAESKRGRHRDE